MARGPMIHIFRDLLLPCFLLSLVICMERKRGDIKCSIHRMIEIGSTQMIYIAGYLR